MPPEVAKNTKVPTIEGKLADEKIRKNRTLKPRTVLDIIRRGRDILRQNLKLQGTKVIGYHPSKFNINGKVAVESEHANRRTDTDVTSLLHSEW